MASNDNDKDNSDTSNTGKRGKNNNASRNRSAAAAAEDDDTASAEREPPPYMYDPRQFQNPHPPCQPDLRYRPRWQNRSSSAPARDYATSNR